MAVDSRFSVLLEGRSFLESPRWYDGALRGQHGFLVYPLAFFPAGWHVATFAGGPFLFVVLLPLYWMGGAAFAYNVATLLAFLVAFAGMLKLARLFIMKFQPGSPVFAIRPNNFF